MRTPLLRGGRRRRTDVRWRRAGGWHGSRIGAKPQADERGGTDFACRAEIPIGLKLAEGIHGPCIPDAVRFGFEITFVGQCLLNLTITVRSGSQLAGPECGGSFGGFPR